MFYIKYGDTRTISLNIGETVSFSASNNNLLSVDSFGVVSVLIEAIQPTTVFIFANDAAGNNRFTYSFMVLPSAFDMTKIADQNGNEVLPQVNYVSPLTLGA